MSREEIKPKPLLSGKDILGLGYMEGPIVGKILRSVEESQLERKLNTKEGALEFVKKEFKLPTPQTPSK